MNSEAKDSAGQLLARIEDHRDIEGLANSIKSAEREENVLSKLWAMFLPSSKTTSFKYKQVSAKGYKLK